MLPCQDPTRSETGDSLFDCAASIAVKSKARDQDLTHHAFAAIISSSRIVMHSRLGVWTASDEFVPADDEATSNHDELPTIVPPLTKLRLAMPRVTRPGLLLSNANLLRQSEPSRDRGNDLFKSLSETLKLLCK